VVISSLLPAGGDQGVDQDQVPGGLLLSQSSHSSAWHWTGRLFQVFLSSSLLAKQARAHASYQPGTRHSAGADDLTGQKDLTWHRMDEVTVGHWLEQLPAGHLSNDYSGLPAHDA
jgi:hypothetical protein